MPVARRFEWRVPARDHAWEGQAGDRRLVEATAGGRAGPDRRYRPFVETPALFREFADLPAPLTEAAVVAFADRYGALGVDADLAPRRWEDGERLETWSAEREAMREAVSLLDALVAEDEGELESFARRLRRERNLRLSVEVRLRDDLLPITSLSEPPGRRERADAYLAGLIEGRLPGMTEAQMELDSAPGRPRLVHRPHHLLGVLWLQLALALAEGKTYRRCEGCGAWLEISEEAGRSDRRYCSTACRMRAYRERQERARELAAQGMVAGAIAAELGTDMETVLGWLRR